MQVPDLVRAMPSPPRGRDKPSPAMVAATVAQLQALLAANTDLDPQARKAVSEHLAAVRELVEAPPASLTSGGLNELNAIQDAEGEGSKSDPAAADLDPAEREELENEWMKLCWVARRDMCEDEMLMLTEKTFTRFVHCYALEPQSEAMVIKYWQYLIKLRQDNKKITSACRSADAASSKPRERNAGDVVTASAAASQRSKALPTGITSGNYAPEVYSPTAAMWAAKPEEKAASLRAKTEKARSVREGGSSSKSPRRNGGATSTIDMLSVQSPRPLSPGSPSRRGKLNGTEKVEGAAVIDTGDKRKGKGFGPGFRNPNAWSRF